MVGTGELIVILCILLVLFGGKKLPEIARNLGKGMQEFKRALHSPEEAEEPEKKEAVVHVEDPEQNG